MKTNIDHWLSQPTTRGKFREFEREIIVQIYLFHDLVADHYYFNPGQGNSVTEHITKRNPYRRGPELTKLSEVFFNDGGLPSITHIVDSGRLREDMIQYGMTEGSPDLGSSLDTVEAWLIKYWPRKFKQLLAMTDDHSEAAQLVRNIQEFHFDPTSEVGRRSQDVRGQRILRRVIEMRRRLVQEFELILRERREPSFEKLFGKKKHKQILDIIDVLGLVPKAAKGKSTIIAPYHAATVKFRKDPKYQKDWPAMLSRQYPDFVWGEDIKPIELSIASPPYRDAYTATMERLQCD